MKFIPIGFLVLSLLLLPGKMTWAHHGGTGGGLAIGQSIVDRLYPPRTNVRYVFEFSSLDNGAGHTILNQIRGEYAFWGRFSIGASLPVWTVSNAFLNSNTKLGDVGLLFKAEIWESKRHRMNLFGGLTTTFPTGNDEVSVGAGAVAFTPYFTFLKDWDVIDFFVNVSGNFEADGRVNPTLLYELGVNIEMLKGKVPLSFFLSYQSVVFLVSKGFFPGDMKGYIIPGFLTQIGDHWELSFMGRISIVDNLGIRPGISFNDFATSLFSDIKGSFIFNLGYKF